MAKRALLVGVNTSGLQYCDLDAGLMSECLKKYDYEVLNLTKSKSEPSEDGADKPAISKSQFMREIETWMDDCKKTDTFILYFSGHGVIIRGQLFFLLDDDTGEAKISNKINIGDLIKSFSFCNAENKLIILDCCKALTAAAEWQPVVSERYQILAASGRLEKSKEIDKLRASFLTHRFHKALSNPPTEITDSEGKVRISKLYKWLTKEAKQHNLGEDAQVPIPKLLGDQEVDFEIAIVNSPAKSELEEVPASSELEDASCKSKGIVPDPPPCFWKREEFTTLINTLLPDLSKNKERKSLLIFGDTGMGKTSLILKCLHDKEVKKEYGNDRFHVSCEELKSWEDIISAVRVQVGKLYKEFVHIGNIEFIDYIGKEDKDKYLIALDDVDQALLSDTKQVGELITVLAKRCTVIASLNYCCRPHLVTLEDNKYWGDPIYLHPMNYAQAIEIFKLVTRQEKEEEARFEPLIGQIVSGEGASPLALYLAAKRSQNGNYPELAERWKSLRTKLRGEEKEGKDKIGIAYTFALESSVFGSREEVIKELASIALKKRGLAKSEYEYHFIEAGFADPARKDQLSPAIRDYLSDQLRDRERDASNTSAYSQEKKLSEAFRDVHSAREEPELTPKRARDLVRLLDAHYDENSTKPK